jgi:hypothetical protein
MRFLVAFKTISQPNSFYPLGVLSTVKREYVMWRLCQSASDVALSIGQFHETNCLLGSYAVLKLNSVAVVHQRTIPTERPPLFSEVSANFGG